MMTRVLPFLLILISIGIFFWYVNPTYSVDIADSQQKIASYDRALKAAKAYAARENDLMVERNNMPSEQLDRLKAFLPDDVDNVQLILDLSSLASKTGISLSGFSVNKTADATETASDAMDGGLSSAVSSTNLTDVLEIGVVATGSYDDFRTFLEQTEQSLRILDVTNINVASSGTSGLYTYNITFRLYWLH